MVLFALTGFGNPVLEACRSAGATVPLLVTRHESGSFPYYDEADLESVAREQGIPVWTEAIRGEAFQGEFLRADPDLLLIATYHRKIPDRVLATVKASVNLHPSLLPKYRGPTPIEWAILDGAQQTGVTAHHVTSEYDAGPIAAQRALRISPSETNGSLRRRLARLAGEVAQELLRTWAGESRLPAVSQDEAEATTRPARTLNDTLLRGDETLDQSLRRIRAFAPFPGSLVEVDGVFRPVLEARAKTSEDREPDGGATVFDVADGTLLLQLGPVRDSEV